MCRYGIYGPYKQHFACFKCRKAFKQVADCDLPDHIARERSEDHPMPCPDCNQPMQQMGFDFKAPKKTDRKQWAKVALLFEHGFAYHSCGCGGPGYRPQTLAEAQLFVVEAAELSEAEQLLAKYATRRR